MHGRNCIQHSSKFALHKLTTLWNGEADWTANVNLWSAKFLYTVHECIKNIKRRITNPVFVQF